ncbi:MAG: sulfite exporter TauE/SafE family protein [Ignavibacteriales bacterium]|nr:sulfite exporter TauE/SafE family protein [Ignavibacteriales bacterium]
MEFLLALASGFILGTLHAFDADHLAAVTAFSGKAADAKRSALYGVVWGLGHSVTLFLFGLVAIAFRFVIPPLVRSVSEAVIGVMLVGIGIWVLSGLFRRKRIHIHRHTHDGVEHVHFHSHQAQPDHGHRHSMFLVGAAHGLAGTASVLVLIPIALSHSILAAALYLLVFGVGTMTAMGFFAYLLGSVARAGSAGRLLPVIQGAAGIASIGVGLVWISGSLFAS